MACRPVVIAFCIIQGFLTYNAVVREKAMPRKTPQQIYQLKVTLKNVRPAVWRRFQVDGDSTLQQPHGVLQAVMGWYGGHLHQFVIGEKFYGQPDPEFACRTVLR